MNPTPQEIDRELRARHRELERLRREGSDLADTLRQLAARLAAIFNRVHVLIAELGALAGASDDENPAGPDA